MVIARLDPAGNRIEAHAMELRIRHHQRATLQRLDRRRFFAGESFRLAHGIDAEDCLSKISVPMMPTIATRIGNGITERGQCEAIRRDVRQGPERLRSRAERGRVVDAPE